MNQPANTPDPYATHTFSRLVATHEGGDLDNDLTDKLTSAIAHLENYVQNHGGKPEAVLGVTFKIKKDGQHMHIVADVTDKLPKEPRSGGVYFADSKNRLTKRDPKQIEMFTDVNRAPAPAVTL